MAFFRPRMPKLFHDRSSQLVNIHSRRVEDDRRRLEFSSTSASPNPILNGSPFRSTDAFCGFHKFGSIPRPRCRERANAFYARLGSHSQDLLHVLSEWLTSSVKYESESIDLIVGRRGARTPTSVAGRLSTQNIRVLQGANCRGFPNPRPRLRLNEVLSCCPSPASPCSSVIASLLN